MKWGISHFIIYTHPMRLIFIILLLIQLSTSFSQDKYDYQWLLGYKTSVDVDGTILDFKEMEVNIFRYKKI